MSNFFFFSRRWITGAALLCAFSIPATSRAQLATETAQSDGVSAASQQVADLQKVVDRWDDAIDQRDQYALELVLAPQFIGISDTGEVLNRDQVVSEMVRKDAPRYSLVQKVVSVREVGDVAVVNGTYNRTYQGSRLSHTKVKNERGVFSQVYVRTRTSWECIHAQETLIQESAAATKKKAKEESKSKGKPLGHELGFHLPGMHHSSDASGQPQK
ncbi:MAG: nuclear transport factor 2 family protein [Acidobacteriaceae bacterium]